MSAREPAIGKTQEHTGNIHREAESQLKSYTDMCRGCSEQPVSNKSAEESE